MKTLGVRVSELEQKRLSELAIKRGGTVSDTVREIIGKHFESDSKTQSEKAEHEKTRAKVSDIDTALAAQVQDIQDLKNMLVEIGKMFGAVALNKAGAQK